MELKIESKIKPKNKQFLNKNELCKNYNNQIGSEFYVTNEEKITVL